jgi:hypothetical protein
VVEVTRHEQRIDDELDAALRQNPSFDERRERARARADEIDHRELFRRKSESRDVVPLVEFQRCRAEPREHGVDDGLVTPRGDGRPDGSEHFERRELRATPGVEQVRVLEKRVDRRARQGEKIGDFSLRLRAEAGHELRAIEGARAAEVFAVQLARSRDGGERFVERLLADVPELEQHTPEMSDWLARSELRGRTIGEVNRVLLARRGVRFGEHERARHLAVGHVDEQVHEGRSLERTLRGRLTRSLRHFGQTTIADLVFPSWAPRF